MKRILSTTVAALAVLSVALPASAEASARGSQQVTAASAAGSVRALRCGGLTSMGMPSAAFEGHMLSVTGTHHMSMRFELQERVGATAWAKVNASALNAWRRSHAGVRHFSFVQRIENLRLEGAYRVVVSFRWLDRSGRTIRTGRRASAGCPAVEPFPSG